MNPKTDPDSRLLMVVIAIAVLFMGYLMASVARTSNACVWSVDLDDKLACVSPETADLHNCYARTMLGPDDLNGQRACEEG